MALGNILLLINCFPRIVPAVNRRNKELTIDVLVALRIRMHGAVTLHTSLGLLGMVRYTCHGSLFCEWGRLHDEELYAVYFLPNIIVVMK